MRTLAIDWGAKKSGLAVCDELGLTVRPLATVRGNAENQLRELQEIIHSEEIARIVVGVPLSADGLTGDAANRVLAFIETLKSQVSCPIVTWNERLTSFAADEWMRERGYSFKERQRRSDEIAAAILLEDFLSSALNRPQS
ncbi:MAG: Holliday junction resolvase RuvX [Blastocatellia bacterium]|nr:Holliday junction resolvase RuvX [Blastocatellia bacterium]